jgi:transcriptional regulator with XRE-family HTH domain
VGKAVGRNVPAQTAFQRNLRRECLRFGTIAEFCRAANINRQQFNKYLAGTSKPGLASLRRICDVLSVTPQFLLADNDDFAPRDRPSPENDDLFVLRKIMKLPRQVQLIPNDVPTGFHYCYMWLPQPDELIIKSLLLFSRKNSHLEFVRLTIIRDPRTSTFPLAVGRHAGIVCANDTDIFLLGSNRYKPHQISLMALDKSSASRPGFYSGTILTRIAQSQLCARVLVQPVSREKTAREVIKSLGIVDASDLEHPTLMLGRQLVRLDEQFLEVRQSRQDPPSTPDQIRRTAAR